MNIHGKAFVLAYAFNSLGYIPRLELFTHMIILFNLLRNIRLFSKIAITFYILTSSVDRFQFIHILSNTCYYLFLSISILAGVKHYLIILLWISLMT